MSSEASTMTSSEPPTTTLLAAGSINDNDTELTLALPGESRKSGEQLVGWPPVKSSWKYMTKSMSTDHCKYNYVKVAVDGAPFLRKVNLESYSGYQQLLSAFEDLFSCFPIKNVTNEMKLMDPVNGMEYIPTYEDKDGDWMLVGDVPWKMFVELCKRIRLMKNSEAINGAELLKC